MSVRSDSRESLRSIRVQYIFHNLKNRKVMKKIIMLLLMTIAMTTSVFSTKKAILMNTHQSGASESLGLSAIFKAH